MKYTIPGIVIVMLLGCAPAAPQQVIVGRYVRARVNARDNPAWRGIVGDWDTEYRADGHLLVRGPNGQRVDSRWHLDGDVLTIDDSNDNAGDMSCRLSGIDTASGRYRIRFVGDELHFRALRDECDGRRNVIETHPLRKVR